MARYKDQTEARAAGLKPGAAYDGGWVAWRKEDLDPNDVVTFVPLEIPYQKVYEQDGKKYSYLTVNGLQCVLCINEVNTVNRFFYNAYQNNLDGVRELEKFKRTGPKDAPWSEGGIRGTNTWVYMPESRSAWFDEDGREISSGDYYVIDDRPGREGMPRLLGSHRDLIESGTHPDYKRPPQIISYSIGFDVLLQAFKASLVRLYRAIRQ